MKSHDFQHYYMYPNWEIPQLIVRSLQGGTYEFTIVNSDGSKDIFMDSEKNVQEINNPLNHYTNYDHLTAILKFREFGKDKWPEIFK